MEKFSLEMIDDSFRSYQKGTIINGTVVAKTAAGIVVNIGGKNDGLIVNESEYNNLIKGTKLDVMIIGKPKDGIVEVSAKKAVDIVEKNVQIPEIRKGARFEAIVDSSNHTGLNCFFGSYKVFVPVAQVEEFYVRNLENYKGKKIELVATDFDDENKRIVASRKAILTKDRLEKEEMFWHAIFINKIVTGVVERLADFGAFVNVDGVDCLVHNSEVGFEKFATAKDKFKVGEQHQFRVISIDRDAGKVQLSYKQLQKHPFDDAVSKYTVGDIVEVEIVKILAFGAIAKLADGLEGLIHISEISTETYIKNVHEVCKVGEKKDARIIAIDVERKKLALSLK